MKKFVLIAFILIAMSTALAALSQPALAGGAPFSILTFPNATPQSCGTWQVSGGGGQDVTNWYAVYSLTDGNGTLLHFGVLTRFPVSGTLRGIFNRQPKQNPIHFQAVAFYKGQIYSIGDIQADNPCLPASHQPTPTVIVPTAIFTASARPPTLTATPVSPTAVITTTVNVTASPAQAYIGCNFSIAYGSVGSVHAPYIRATVNLASDLSVILANQVALLTGPSFNLYMTYPVQPAGTHLVVSVGEWNGSQYVHPATLIAGDCIAPTPTHTVQALTITPSFVPSLVPSSTPTFVLSLVPSSTPTFGPSLVPSSTPTFVLSLVPSSTPTFVPSLIPSSTPTHTVPAPTATLTPTSTHTRPVPSATVTPTAVFSASQ